MSEQVWKSRRGYEYATQEQADASDRLADAIEDYERAAACLDDALMGVVLSADGRPLPVRGRVFIISWHCGFPSGLREIWLGIHCGARLVLDDNRVRIGWDEAGTWRTVLPEHDVYVAERAARSALLAEKLRQLERYQWDVYQEERQQGMRHE